jgi:Ca-activated chloride channel family protein
LEISGVQVSDRFPSADIPDIFKGTQLIVFGRYTGSGNVKVTITGMADNTRKTFTLNAVLPDKEDENEFMPQLWAARKIGYLLDEIRLHSNQELIDEVVRLSKTYGIPTEYTTFLADERKTALGLKEDMIIVRKKAASASKVNSGSFGVAQSANAQASRDANQMQGGFSGGMSGAANKFEIVGKPAANGRIGGTYQDSDDRMVVVANVQNIAKRTFYQRGDYWEDSELQPKQALVQIKQFSDAHFKLLKAYPKLSQYSTLGNLRVILENSQALEIGPNGMDTMTDAEIRALLK